MTVSIIAGVVAAICLYLMLRRDAVDAVYYAPSETLPAPPQPWGRDDYQPWEAELDGYDNPEEAIAAITRLWNAAVRDGDTEAADIFFKEYERLCREAYS